VLKTQICVTRPQCVKSDKLLYISIEIIVIVTHWNTRGKINVPLTGCWKNGEVSSVVDRIREDI